MKGLFLIIVFIPVLLAGCAGKSPEEHLAEAEYCQQYTEGEISRAIGASYTYQNNSVYRVLYDTCMHKAVGERHYERSLWTGDQGMAPK